MHRFNYGPASKGLRLLLVLAVYFGTSLINGAWAADEWTDLQCGHLLDVENRTVLRNAHVLVKNDRIEAVGQNVKVPRGAKIIDLSDSYCAPGLMDMHVHLFVDHSLPGSDSFLQQSSATNALIGLKNAQILLDSGFTTVRTPGDIEFGFAGIEVRNAVNRGEVIGPRMSIGPHVLSETGGHLDLNQYAADGPKIEGLIVKAGTDNARAAVRREIKYGADWIKIAASGGVMSQNDDPNVQGFSDEEIQAFVDETHRHGKKITAHVHGNKAGLTAAKAGIDCIEHGTMLEQDTIDVMAQKGIFLVPTVYVLDWILEQGVNGFITQNNYEKALLVSKKHRRALKMAMDAGVPLALGSDPIFPMDQAIREFNAMVKAGVPAWETLRAGTINSADLLGMKDQTGSLTAGKLADVVAMPGNPLDDMTAVESVSFVMKGGEIYRHGDYTFMDAQ